MKVLLDGQLVPIARPTLKAAIGAAALQAERSGRIIVSAVADGATLSDGQLRDPSDEASGIVELTLATAEPARMISDMLRAAADAVTSVRTTQKDAAALISAGKTNEVSEHLQTVFGVWQAVCEGVQNAADMLQVDLGALRVPDGAGETLTIAPLIEVLVDRLREVQRALTESDWSALSDALGFDLDDSARDWQVALVGFAQVVSSAKANGGGGA
jgi:hypothetical protein